MCSRLLSIVIGMSLLTPMAHALADEPPVATLDAVEPVQVKQFVKERARDARDLALGNPAPRAVVPTDLDCATLYNRRVALMRGQVDANPTDFMGDPRIRTSALLGTVWIPAFAYLPFRTVQQFRERLKQVNANAESNGEATAGEIYRRVRSDIIQAQREALLTARDDGTFSAGPLTAALNALDAEQISMDLRVSSFNR